MNKFREMLVRKSMPQRGIWRDNRQRCLYKSTRQVHNPRRNQDGKSDRDRICGNQFVLRASDYVVMFRRLESMTCVN